MSVISDIQSCATSAGANIFHYERPNLENISIDELSASSILCYCEEINSVNLSVDSNGISDSIQLRIAFIRQVNICDTAIINSSIMNAMLQCCRSFIINITNTENYQKSITANAVKYEENVNDANFVGWQLSLTLIPRDGYSEC